MKKVFGLGLLLCFFGCQSDEPDRLIVGEWVLREYVPVNFAGGGPKVYYTNNWWIERFTRNGNYEQIINDTLRMTATYIVSEDGKAINFNNVVRYEKNGKKSDGGLFPYWVYQLDRQTFTHTLAMSHSSVYTFHKRRK